MGLILVREKHPDFFSTKVLCWTGAVSLSSEAGSHDITMSLKAAWEGRDDPVAASLVTQTDPL